MFEVREVQCKRDVFQILDEIAEKVIHFDIEAIRQSFLSGGINTKEIKGDTPTSLMEEIRGGVIATLNYGMFEGGAYCMKAMLQKVLIEVDNRALQFASFSQEPFVPVVIQGTSSEFDQSPTPPLPPYPWPNDGDRPEKKAA